MRRLIWILPLVIACACGGGNGDNNNEKADLRNERVEEIVALDKEVRSVTDLNNPLSKAKVDNLILKMKNFAIANPKDSLTPEYLLKCADLNLALGNFEQSIGFLNNLTRNHPTYEKIVEATYFKGFIQEVYMNQYGEALQTYKKLIEQYPNHRLAADAQAAIENLELSDEELIQKLKSKNQPES